MYMTMTYRDIDMEKGEHACDLSGGGEAPAAGALQWPVPFQFNGEGILIFDLLYNKYILM